MKRRAKRLTQGLIRSEKLGLERANFSDLTHLVHRFKQVPTSLPLLKSERFLPESFEAFKFSNIHTTIILMVEEAVTSMSDDEWGIYDWASVPVNVLFSTSLVSGRGLCAAFASSSGDELILLPWAKAITQKKSLAFLASAESSGLGVLPRGVSSLLPHLEDLSPRRSFCVACALFLLTSLR